MQFNLHVLVREPATKPVFTPFVHELGQGVANPLVKRALFRLYKSSVATKMKHPPVITTAMAASKHFHYFPALGLVAKESQLKFLSRNASDRILLHASPNSICIGLTTVTAE